MTETYRIYIIDDHPVLVEGLLKLFASEERLEPVGTASDFHSALSSVRNLKPDILILDLTLPGGSGLDLIKQIGIDAPETKILVFSMHEYMYHAGRTMRAGAKGYVSKHDPPEVLLEGIYEVLAGRFYFRKDMRPNGNLNYPIDLLTDREFEVFSHLGEGKSRNQIADDLMLSVRTVGVHLENIKGKLNLKHLSELLPIAVNWKKLD